MTVTAVVIALSVLSLPVVLLLAGRRNEGRFVHQWLAVLSPSGFAELQLLRNEFETDVVAVQYACMRAVGERRAGSIQDAILTLRAGCQYLEVTTERRLTLLASLAGLCRLVEAIAPVQPLRPASFRLRQLWTAAGVALLIHHLLVGARERLQLRLALLRYGYLTATRIFRRAGAQRSWILLGDATADYGTLGDETLEALRLVLVSRDAVRREPVLARG